MSTVGPDGHPYADFTRASCDVVRSHTIETDGSEQQRQDAEESAQPREQTLLVKVDRDLLLHGLDVGDGKVRVHLPEDLSDAWLHRALVAGAGPYFGAGVEVAPLLVVLLDRFAVCAPLGQRSEDHGCSRLVGICVLCVLHHSDDLQAGGVGGLNKAKESSDGVSLRIETADEGLVDDSDTARLSIVFVSEVAARDQRMSQGA